MFSDRLKELRKRNKISQKALATEIGFSQQAIAKWENDTATPSPEVIVQLSKFFGVSTDYLLGNTSNPTPELIIPDELKDVKIAFHRGEFEDLTQDEIDALAVLAKTLKEQRKNRDK